MPAVDAASAMYAIDGAITSAIAAA